MESRWIKYRLELNDQLPFADQGSSFEHGGAANTPYLLFFQVTGLLLLRLVLKLKTLKTFTERLNPVAGPFHKLPFITDPRITRVRHPYDKATHMINFLLFQLPNFNVPFLSTTMPEDNATIENRIQDALDALSNQEKPNISKTARDYHVPYQRLRYRWQGRPSLLQRHPTHRLLNESQEKVLCTFMDTMDDLGLCPRRNQVEAAANSILREARSDPSISVGEHWVTRFLKRHPDFKRRRRRALDIERMQALDKTATQAWFYQYHQIIAEKGILPQDIYNFDETGFQIGVGKDQWIITREPKKKIFSGTDTNRESVTVVESVNADGSFVIALVIILTGRQILLRWFDNITEECIVVNDSGYMNQQLAY